MLERLEQPLPANWEEQRDLLLAPTARGVRPATSRTRSSCSQRATARWRPLRRPARPPRPEMRAKLTPLLERLANGHGGGSSDRLASVAGALLAQPAGWFSKSRMHASICSRSESVMQNMAKCAHRLFTTRNSLFGISLCSAPQSSDGKNMS
jgi:hypothetical protein